LIPTDAHVGKVTAMEDMMMESDSASMIEDLAPTELKWSVPLLVASLQEQKSRIIANWALRVATLPAFRAMPDLGLEDVQRRIPQVLDGALTATATSDPTMDPGPIERAAELAAAHGRARLLDDFGIGDLLAEFHALRVEVWSALWRVAESADQTLSLVRELDSRLSESFDVIVAAAAESWVSAKLEGQAER
jgi:hypothetical protein